jgi:hypothetical protein
MLSSQGDSLRSVGCRFTISRARTLGADSRLLIDRHRQLLPQQAMRHTGTLGRDDSGWSPARRAYSPGVRLRIRIGQDDHLEVWSPEQPQVMFVNRSLTDDIRRRAYGCARQHRLSCRLKVRDQVCSDG